MRRIGLYGLLILCAQLLTAQLTVLPLKKDPGRTATIYAQMEVNAATLPFWDDFSITHGAPDSLRIWGSDTSRQWDPVQSEHVFVNTTLAINPPTLNVATFDGLDKNGGFHDMSDAVADELVSMPIDLSSYSANDDIYLSFYWQAGGNVEIPEEGDSLILEFRDADTDWIQVWQEEGSENIDPTVFSQVMIPVGSEFLGDSMQFAFRSYGDLDGPFDAWHLDWIYLNANRSTTELDSGYLDGAFTNDLTSLLFPFQSIPANQFESTNEFIRNQEVGVSNLRGSLQDKPLFVPNINYTLTNTNTGGIIIADTDRAYGVLNPQESDTARLLLQDTTKGFIFLEDLSFTSILPLDSVVLRTEVTLASGDAQLHGSVIDLAINDTLTKDFTLHNYYAYDDGTAEFAAGTNIRNGQVAIQYWVENPDTLTRVDINFPNISPSQNGSTIILNIFRNLSEEGLASSQQITVVNNSSRDAFESYSLEKPVVVSDTFYVAYQQSVNDFLAIGFDRSNPDAAQHIFENIDGEWIQNISLMGALMIRPVFESGLDIVLGEPEVGEEVTLYPNPTNGLFKIEGDYTHVELMDLSGRILATQEKQATHDITRFGQGLYLLRIHRRNTYQVEKIILK